MQKIKDFLYHWSVTRYFLNIIKHSYFKKHLNPVFIETGSFMGHGIRAALRAGFPIIVSIEQKLGDWMYCMFRFGHKMNVFIYHENSVDILPIILKDINKRCTFWLDAHNSGVDNSPLLKELQIIKDHHIKDHTILIDDMRLYKDWRDRIEAILYSINSNYKISYKFGVTFNDILIAEIT